MNIQDWIISLAATWNHRLTREQIAIWIEELGAWHMMPYHWDRLLRLARRECDKFPSIAQLWAITRGFDTEDKKSVPVFETWEDEKGRVWARDTGRKQPTFPTEEQIEKWKYEAVYGQDARAAFGMGYIQGGGKMEEVDAIFRDVTKPEKLKSKYHKSEFSHVAL